MSFIATAIVGSAVVGAVAVSSASSRAAGAVERGSASAAAATMESTAMQIAEIQRQFDYQQQILAPFVANQYAGQAAYMDLLGIGGGATAQTGQPPPGGGGPGGNVYDAFQQPDGSYRVGAGGQQMIPGPGGGGERDWDAEMADIDQQIADLKAGGIQRTGGGVGGMVGGAFQIQRDVAALEAQRGQIQADQADYARGATARNAPQYPGSGRTSFNRGDRGQFIDPNLDQTRLADNTRLGGQVRSTLQADTDLYGDPFRQDVAGRSLAAGAAATSVYGDVFEASPGYAFQREEMDRATDRVGSAGGNYGGRAIMEAARRSQGLAQGDYYNWAQGRSRDVDRLTGAEATDAGRLDAAGVNYLGRRAGDASRMDAAAAQEDRLMAGDQARGDQAYYNYLAQLSSVGGVGGNPAAQAVNSSAAAGGAVAGAYGSQGQQLAANYQNLGQNQGNIYAGAGAGYNDIIQGSISNAVTAFGKPTPPPPVV